MSENFLVEIISPDNLIIESEATDVTIPSYEGQMGILKDHIPLITFLRPGLIIIKNDNKEKIFFVEEGTVEFSKNKLLILSTTARNLEDLDKNSIDNLIQSSQNELSSTEINDKEKYLLSHKINSLREIN
jgi:ATP synthase F1 epsilon subunit|tara:strand:- start:833 stop:1222 length:390 start_codon:yes stop_codon:yes gene_type:complete